MQGIHSCQQPHGDIDMKVIGILGIAAAILAAGAAEVQVSDLTGNAKVSKFKIYGKNRVVNAGFPITALPADLAGETFVSVPRGAAGQPGAAYSVSVDARPGFICWSRIAAPPPFRRGGPGFPPPFAGETILRIPST